MGPLLIFPANYYFAKRRMKGIQKFKNSHLFKPLTLARLALGLVMFHYTKRELESMFVHIFSRPTMSFKGSIKRTKNLINQQLVGW